MTPLWRAFSGIRVFNNRRRRQLRRLARTIATASGTDTRDQLRRLAELVADRLSGLPPTTFQCAPCGRRVYRYPDDIPPDQLECPEHGPLEPFTMADWHAEWTRRGQPAHLNWRRRPLC